MIAFTKAHACGNDFLIVAEEDTKGLDKAALAEQLCHRNTGVGADGVEFFAWTGELSGRIRLYNSDGSVAEISGNGTRCVAAWMAEERNCQAGDSLVIETDAGPRTCRIEELRDSAEQGPTALITTDMDVPEWETRAVELADGTVMEGVFVSMGNPHFVILIENPPREDGFSDFSLGDRSWQEIGEEICFHPDFYEQTNVEFVQRMSSGRGQCDQVALRIFERGVGPTTSSGTGTSAAATAMIAVWGAQSPIEVFAPGGVQSVRWERADEPLLLTGPAILVARGEAW